MNNLRDVFDLSVAQENTIAPYYELTIKRLP